jgi:hypothetical protein
VWRGHSYRCGDYGCDRCGPTDFLSHLQRFSNTCEAFKNMQREFCLRPAAKISQRRSR